MPRNNQNVIKIISGNMRNRAGSKNHVRIPVGGSAKGSKVIKPHSFFDVNIGRILKLLKL